MLADAEGGTASVNGATAEVAAGGSVSAAKGEASVTATAGAATVAGTVTGEESAAVTATGGDAKVSGTVTSSGANGVAKIQSTDQNVEISGAVSATGNKAVVDVDANGDVTVDGATVKAGNDVLVESSNGNIAVKNSAVTAGEDLRFGATKGSVTVDTGVTASAGENATIEAKNDVTINSDFVAKDGDAYVESKSGNVTMADGTEIKAGDDAYLGAKKIDVATVTAGDAAWIESTGSGGISGVDGKDGLNVNAKKLRLEANGDIGTSADPIKTNVENIEAVSKNGSVNFEDKDGFTIGGIAAKDLNPTKVKEDGTTDSNAKKAKEVSGISAAGDVGLSANGTMTIQEDVTAGRVSITVQNGSLLQTGGDNTVHVKNGVAENKSLKSAINASGGVTLNVSGSIGTVGKNEYALVGVQGPVTANGGGDVAIGAANGSDLQVNNISASGNAAVYTTGTITGNAVGNGGGSISGQNVHVTAHDFKGGEVNIAVRKNLVNNNLEGGYKTQIAIYKTASGGNRNPSVANEPNGSIVFLDGRLVGGDIQTINKLGALEAFPVQTPELKSEQGVFGNPFFMHGDMDVSEPVALGIIDFLLVDPAAIRYGAEFPLEADTQVEAAGLSPEFSYRFLGKKDSGKQDSEAPSSRQTSEGKKGKSE